MPRVRAGAAKWVQRATGAARDYATGVQQPRVSWSQATAASESAYEAGVQDAIGRKAFSKGVTKAGDSTWLQGITTKGVQRYAPGVQAAQAKYEANFAPYRQVIEATNLPPRGRRGDPANLERVRVLDVALHNQRVSQRSG